MALTLKILQNSLGKLQHQVQDQKAKLEVELKASKPISDTDQGWLDGTGNLVDEVCILNTLTHTSESDYEQAFASLNSHDKSIVEKLEKLTGNSNKHKCPEHSVKSSSDGHHPQEKKAEKKAQFTQKENATLVQRIKILDWHHANGKN
ncbi:hypothetical protein JVU11DRAFT_9034 [Chiua virens]|nr:hypothetical protein JVU11DRAFT_9034 [Chiua virens]